MFAPVSPMLLYDKLRFVNVVLPVNAVAKFISPSILTLLPDNSLAKGLVIVP